MSKNEKLAKLRNQEFDTKELIGLIDEKELKKIAGAGDVNPETTPTTATVTTVLVGATISVCPTTKCTSRC
ncbi:class II lanthipeptide, LchA2/BrtA2 family [Bacillus tropicus]|uniref:class II lanthipeptide, LchA2/BrtA2 family n=2 Tax=Bacillus tropicus TaxID=2026188 RepID=UPI001121ACC3|nr:class II lanthipeptide, LchA2/BrtA2 family [Bacillus tropicus]TNP10152.1 lantibiotic cytolysin [Bacillus tropicus]